MPTSRRPPRADRPRGIPAAAKSRNHKLATFQMAVVADAFRKSAIHFAVRRFTQSALREGLDAAFSAQLARIGRQRLASPQSNPPGAYCVCLNRVPRKY